MIKTENGNSKENIYLFPNGKSIQQFWNTFVTRSEIWKFDSALDSQQVPAHHCHTICPTCSGV